MDPNENLRRQREVASIILDPPDRSQVFPYSTMVDAAEDLAALVRSMDEWLRRGGFPPDDWNPVIHAMRAQEGSP